MDVIDLITNNKLTWEGLIKDIVKKEKMDPWNIDISLLIDKFAEAIKEIREDLRIAGKFILVLALLLKLKADYLEGMKEKEKKKVERLPEPKVKIFPRVFGLRERKVTLNELLEHLRKAIERYEKKRKRKVKRKRKNFMITFEKFDIAKEKIELYLRILTFFKKYNKERILFWELLPSEEKIIIIHLFLTLLHLESEGKIIMEQEDLFGDIYVRRPN